nr:hypothetical protein [uncultured Catonella sp.]
MNYSIYKRTKLEWFKLMGIWFLISISLGMLFYKSFIGILIIVPFGIVFEKINKKKLIEKRKNELSGQFVEFLQVIMSSLKAGTSLERAILSARERLYSLYNNDSLIIIELLSMERSLKMNIPVEDILYDFGKRSGIEDINQFAEVCKVSKRAGGNLIKVMEHTIRCIVDKNEMEREIQAFISGKKIEGKFMTAILPAILLYMNISMSDMMKSLYQSSLGKAVMSGVLIGYGLCCLWFDKITDIKV